MLYQKENLMIDPEDLRKPEAINRIIQATGVDTNKISDGKHTFEELYAWIDNLYLLLKAYGVQNDL